MEKRFIGLIVLISAVCLMPAKAQEFPFRNTALSFEERVNDWSSRMTLQEKADQLLYTAPAIPRLGIPPITGGMKLFMVLPDQALQPVFLSR